MSNDIDESQARPLLVRTADGVNWAYIGDGRYRRTDERTVGGCLEDALHSLTVDAIGDTYCTTCDEEQLDFENDGFDDEDGDFDDEEDYNDE